MYGDLKLTFIQQCLQQFVAESRETMQAAMRRRKVGKTGESYDSIQGGVKQQGAGAEAELKFKEALRFVDMGVGRAHPLGGLKLMSVALKASKTKGAAQVKDEVRKPKKVYSKPAYSRLGYLYGKLLYGYTEETIAILKQQLQQNGIGNNPA